VSRVVATSEPITRQPGRPRSSEDPPGSRLVVHLDLTKTFRLQILLRKTGVLSKSPYTAPCAPSLRSASVPVADRLDGVHPTPGYERQRFGAVPQTSPPVPFHRRRLLRPKLPHPSFPFLLYVPNNENIRGYKMPKGEHVFRERHSASLASSRLTIITRTFLLLQGGKLRQTIGTVFVLPRLEAIDDDALHRELPAGSRRERQRGHRCGAAGPHGPSRRGDKTMCRRTRRTESPDEPFYEGRTNHISGVTGNRMLWEEGLAKHARAKTKRAADDILHHHRNNDDGDDEVVFAKSPMRERLGFGLGTNKLPGAPPRT
jgi:hypothetical protein